MKYFIVNTLEDGKVCKSAICTSFAKSAKIDIENYWRENQLYDNKVISVNEVSYEDWKNLVYRGQEDTKCV